MQGQGADQQAYDRGTTIFSPDGRLYQVEYAREAVKQGSASIGVRTAGGVVLLIDQAKSSPLMERGSVEKLHKADAHVGIASAGHVADGRRLIDFARRQAQGNRLRYEEPIGVEALAKRISDQVQEFTQVGGARPFGVALVVGGVEDGRPRLFTTNPAGTPNEWAAVAVGQNRRAVQEFLEDEYEEGLALADGIELAFRALASVKDDPPPPDAVGIATVDAEDGRYHELADDEVAQRLDDIAK